MYKGKFSFMSNECDKEGILCQKFVIDGRRSAAV